MDFGSRLISNKRAFQNYNRYKHRIMHENDSARADVVLNLIPLLLHLNHPALPGFRENQDCPCGIKIMERPADSRFEILSKMPEKISKKSIQESMPRIREIDGVFAIGSLGSVGETRGSDCDIWVVVDAALLGCDRIRILESKLTAISKWVEKLYNIEMYFFLLDINDIRSNNFGAISHEAAGSSLKSLLKEEFYRTMTLIEGRIPLWWVTPATDDPDSYRVISESLSGYEGVNPDDYIDLGEISRIYENELLTAALWHMHKALSDPLKSVLKMAQVKMHLDLHSNMELFCNVLKRKVHDARAEDVVDPYIEAFRNIEKHFLANENVHTVNMLRKCIYLKARPSIEPRHLIRIGADDKASLISGLVKEWGWSLRTVELLNSFPCWHIDIYKRFGKELHDFLKNSALALLKNAGSAVKGAVVDQDTEIEVLRRRIESVYVRKDDKIESEKRIRKNEPGFDDLYFNYRNGIWEVFKTPDCNGGSGIIISSRRIAGVISWLVFNRRFSSSTSCHMMPNTTSVYLSDIQTLMQSLLPIVPDSSLIGLDRDALLKGMTIDKVIFMGNLEQPASAFLKEIDVLVLNSWRELFCIQMDKEELGLWFRTTCSKNTEISIWLPGGSDSRSLARELMTAVGGKG